jgi:hypothetical protein
VGRSRHNVAQQLHFARRRLGVIVGEGLEAQCAPRPQLGGLGHPSVRLAAGNAQPIGQHLRQPPTQLVRPGLLAR